MEPARQPLDRGPRLQHPGRRGRGRLRRAARHVEPGELALPQPHAEPVVEHRRVERHLAVAVGVDVPEADVLRARELHRPGERLVAADHPVDVEVRDRDPARVPDLERQGEAALAALLLGLQRVELPVRDAVELHLVADVVLARHLVDAAARRRVRHQQAGLRERARGPEVEERAAAAVGHPQARVLAVPAAARRRGRPSGRCCTGSRAGRRAPSCRGRPGSARRSSSIARPAIHFAATARGLMPFV